MRQNSVFWTVPAFGLAALTTPFELFGLPLAPPVALILGAVAGWRAALPRSTGVLERSLRAGLVVGLGSLARAVVGLVLAGLVACNLPAVQAYVQTSEPHPEARLPEGLIAPLAAFSPPRPRGAGSRSVPKTFGEDKMNAVQKTVPLRDAPQHPSRRRSTRKKAGRVLALTGGVLAGVVGLGWLGLQLEPPPFPALEAPTGLAETVPLPENLPAPVERFYRKLYGERVPVVRSAVVSGRATLRLGGVTFPARFRFTHEAGQGYRHYIEATMFGLPVMRVNETYLNGKGRLELPFGVTENEPKVDQAANLGLWAEGVWFPALYLTDPRVRWEAVDQTTALLVVPFGEDEERFTVRFDPETGLVRLLESMRYKGAHDAHKTLWLNDALVWGELDDHLVLTESALTWFGDGAPWARFRVEEVVYNVDVRASLGRRGL